MRKLIVLLLGVVVLTNCYAQRDSKKEKKAKNAETEAVAPVEEPEEAPVVTEECLMNMSLFNESAKNNQYADALEPWNQVFENCPSANKVIYSQGRFILQWELSQQKDDASYQKVFDKLMLMYDKRIKYFGDDARYPTAWIKGIKALDYLLYVKNDAMKKPAYHWMEESIDGLGEKSEIEVLRQFILLADKYYAADKSFAEEYIADYLKVNAILESLSKSSDPKEAELAAQYKSGVDVVFAESGAADCATLDGLYADNVGKNKDDINYLGKVVSFYKRVKCTDSEVYFKAAQFAYQIQPSAESAAALGAMSYTKGEYAKAISFYDDATRLSDNNQDKADYQYTIAQICYSKLDNYPKTKSYALKSLDYDSSKGSAYLIIGLAYAAAKGIYDDPVLAKSVFWVAVDKFVKAKQVDPSLTADADKLISTYSRHFPSKEDIFFKPELQSGKSFYVGGWIGENTICR